uniref:Uncharacterized protein n=1 Tax=Grammatophora oceanica TaxID=210454 RepID=A0A7S1YIV3_9STRA
MSSWRQKEEPGHSSVLLHPEQPWLGLPKSRSPPVGFDTAKIMAQFPLLLKTVSFGQSPSNSHNLCATVVVFFLQHLPNDEALSLVVGFVSGPVLSSVTGHGTSIATTNVRVSEG